MSCAAIWTCDETQCFYQHAKSSSGTGKWVKGMNAYLPRRLVYPIIIAAGISDQCAFFSGHDPTTRMKLGEI